MCSVSYYHQCNEVRVSMLVSIDVYTAKYTHLLNMRREDKKFPSLNCIPILMYTMSTDRHIFNFNDSVFEHVIYSLDLLTKYTL